MLELHIRFANLLRHDKGQGLVEYALIILFAAIVAVAGLTALGTELSAAFTTASGTFPGT